MVRGKGIFTAGTIVSMVIMFISLMCGFAEDGYDSYYTYSHSYYPYYSYDRQYHSRWYSFADEFGELFGLLFALVLVYIVFSIIAMSLYKKSVTAIKVIHLIITIVTYSFAAIVFAAAADEGHDVFAPVLLFGALCTAFPFQLVVNIVGLSAKKEPEAPVQPVYAYQPPVYAYQPPVYAAPPVAPAPQAVPAPSNDTVEMLKQLKDLRDAGVLTEEEYNAKRQQYVNQI